MTCFLTKPSLPHTISLFLSIIFFRFCFLKYLPENNFSMDCFAYSPENMRVPNGKGCL